MTDDQSDAMLEIKALQSIAEALAPLDNLAAQRVLRWASDRFGVASAPSTDPGLNPVRAAAPLTRATDHESVGELYAAATPNSDPERALVVGFWLDKEGTEEFDSQTLNSQLKNMGHGISNITGALSNLMNRKPQLVIQTRKSGSSRQARKKYRVTTAGKQAVEAMLAAND